MRQLTDDVRAWCVLVQEQVRLWADNLDVAVEPGVAAQERLRAQWQEARF